MVIVIGIVFVVFVVALEVVLVQDVLVTALAKWQIRFHNIKDTKKKRKEKQKKKQKTTKKLTTYTCVDWQHDC